MSCSIGPYTSTRQAAPVAPAAALRAAAERLQNIGTGNSNSGGSNPSDTRRPNFLLDVPISAIDVDRWEKRWEEAKASGGATAEEARVGTYFQHVSAAYAARHQSSTASGVEASAAAVESGPTRHLAPFPPFVFAAVKTLPMTQLLKLRRQWLPHRQRFAVHQQRMGLLDAVLNHAVVALVGPPGTGRTLQVPIILSETEVLKRRRLVVVSANATAARLTVRRLLEERGEDAVTSRTVAAALPNFLEATESSSVVVTTAEVLLRQLLCDPCLDDVSCVVFDDAHLRNESTELCLSLLRDLLTAQQQWTLLQQQRASTAASGAEGTVSSTNTAEVARKRMLHVLFNCPDEACATSLLTFLAPSRCTATTVNLQPSPSLITASTTLYLEECVQWLLKCEKEGPTLFGSGNSTVESVLLSYAENVDAVARVMAAGDADFAHPAAFRRYWMALLEECVSAYDAADRQARQGSESSATASPLPSILIVAPNNHYVHAIANALNEVRENAAVEDPAAHRVCTPLADDAPFTNFLGTARRTAVQDVRQRSILVATCELSQTVLPSQVDVGLVVDCARNGYVTVDPNTMADTCTIDYSSIGQLRHRRRLAKVTSAASEGGGSATAAATTASVPMVIQLIPKSVLHSAQHRRVSADPGQHVVFHLPFYRYVQLYQALQAREEAIASQRAASLVAALNSVNNKNNTNPSLISKVSTILASQLIGTPAATANKYETLRRVMASVEAYLRSSGHLGVDQSGRLSLRPMGVLSLCLPVPLPVGRLLVAGSLLQPSTAALTAVGALWCCSDLLSLPGTGSVRVADASDAAREAVEERAILLNEARLFFSRDSLSDVVSAFHVYQMWCSVRGKAEAEQDFLEECGMSAAVLQTVFATQVELCRVLGVYRLMGNVASTQVSSAAGATEVEKKLRLVVASLAAASTAAAAQELTEAVGMAMSSLPQEVSASRALHACLTAALYPNCVLPTGEDGVGLLYDAVSAAVAYTAAGAANTAAGGAPGQGPVGRRVASFGQDCLLADTTQAAKAAGKPFVFLAKSIADETSREAAGSTASTSSISTTVVEQLNPLHEAAALVFCGHTYERPRKAPTRCRGWSSVLTNSWRETRRARGLPPVAQLPPTSIHVQSYDTVHCHQVVCAMDQNFALTMRATTSKWLQQLRARVGEQLAALVRGGAAGASSFAAVGSELAAAWMWWERRHQHSREWLREERVVFAHQQERGKADEAVEEEEEASTVANTPESAAKAAALRQRLYGYYEWQLRPGTPAAVVVPANLDRLAAAGKSAAVAAGDKGRGDSIKASALGEGEEGEEEAAADAASGAAAPTAEGGLPATYTGKIPPADIDRIFRQCARSVAAKGTREAEARLLRDSPDMFYFLNPENEYHEYYLYLLRQAAPDMEVLGDNLEELIYFLEGLETELREELGLPSKEQEAEEAEHEGVLDGDGNASAGAVEEKNFWGSSDSGAGTGGAASGATVGGYGVAEDADAYLGEDNGGLQLESAAVNLKKNTGPTLAEQIEQAKRTQANPAAASSASAAASQGLTSNTAGVSAATAANLMMPTSMVHAVGSGIANAPFVSTGAGETLADKLKAMQLAAQGGAGGTSTSQTAPFMFGTVTSQQPQPHAHSTAGDGASTDFMVPPPTAEDLLAAISTGGADSSYSKDPNPNSGILSFDASGAASLTRQRYSFLPQPNSSGGNNSIEAPTTEELMALLGAAPPTSAAAANSMMPDSGGDVATSDLLNSVLGILPLAAPAMANPLLVPPPAIPAKAVEERAPSVLVYPVPDCRKHGGNVRMLLAKGLSEVLNMRVGPTLIVGRVARVDVPNRNVEARALALRKFTCADATVYILKNDRIIDDPDRMRREMEYRRDHREREAEAQHARRRLRTEDTTTPSARYGRAGARDYGATATAAGVDPTLAGASVDPSAVGHPGVAAIATTTGIQIGVLSSDDDDDASDSDKSSSTSSSSSSSSSSK